MDIFYGVIVFIIGLILGSFYNVCIFRIPRSESIVFPPSHCLNCIGVIKKYDLIPVVSYILLKGKCRSCGTKISIQYPIVELITGILFLILYLNFGFTIRFVFYIFLISILMITSLIDLNTEYIYETISIIGGIGGVLFIAYSYFSQGEVLTYILGSLLAGGIISIFAFLGAMGWGDVEIAFVCGLYLGLYNSIVMIFLSIIIGGVVGSILLITKKKKLNTKATMPFGPCIALGAFISLVYGNLMSNMFLNYIQ